jgi:hypothetical protein
LGQAIAQGSRVYGVYRVSRVHGVRVTKIERFEDVKAWQEARVSAEVTRLPPRFIRYLLSKEKRTRNPKNSTNSSNF